MPRIPPLETSRLLIRELVREDLTAAHTILNDSFGEIPLDERRRWLEWTLLNYEWLGQVYQPPYNDRAIVLRANGVLVGLTGFEPTFSPLGLLPSFASSSSADRMQTPDFGLFWAVATAYRRQGYASEAAQAMVDYGFGVLGLKRIVALTQHDNVASMAVMRHIGMRVERNPHADPPYFQVMGWLMNPQAQD